MNGEALHHLILYYDVQDSAQLTNPAKLAARELLRDCRDRALAAAAIPADSVSFNDTGDGELILFDARVSKIQVLSDWLSAFHDRLQRAYERSADRFQTRLELNAGEVHQSLDGHAGTDLDLGARLVSAPAAKAVLAATPSAALAVIVSDEIYRQVVKPNAPIFDPASFAPIPVRVKETDTSAWLHLPGWKRVPMPAALAAPEPPPPLDGAASRVGFDRISVQGPVGVIGEQHVQGDFNFGMPGGAR